MKLKYLGAHENTSGVPKGDKNKPPQSPDNDLPAPEFATDNHSFSNQNSKVGRNTAPNLNKSKIKGKK